VFESEFLTSANESKQTYIRLISRAAELLWEFFPNQPYSGASARTLNDLIPSDFLPDQQGSSEQIAETLKLVVSNSVVVSHRETAAHLHCPPALAALVAEVVISALNQSMDSFDQAPVASIIERKILRWLCQEIGLPPVAGGTFTTGGSQSNYIGLLLARDAFLQKTWQWSAQKQGLHPDARRLRILCSEVAHFTVEKSASQLGLGTDAVLRVAVDDRFRMNPADLKTTLEALRAQNLLPMAVVATAGTTDFGSIDPLPEIAATAHETGAWLHVDAAYGGALLFSPQHRSKLAGIEAADSLAIDFHKLFWQPIPCSVFLLQDSRHFEHIKMHADYLNPERHEAAGIPDLITTSLLTSRRFDALKLWISFAALGRHKLAEMIERTIFLANHAAGSIRRTPQLELMCEPQLSTVVFRVLPSRPEIDADHLNTAVRQRLFDSGQAVIGHCRVRNRQCLKFTCMNPTVTEAEMEGLIQKILKVAGDLA
jgi:L-2,4-diaminobutyrate decarboxylase